MCDLEALVDFWVSMICPAGSFISQSRVAIKCNISEWHDISLDISICQRNSSVSNLSSAKSSSIFVLSTYTLSSDTSLVGSTLLVLLA